MTRLPYVFRVTLMRRDGSGMVLLDEEFADFGAALEAAVYALQQVSSEWVARFYAVDASPLVSGGRRFSLVGSIAPQTRWRFSRDERITSSVVSEDGEGQAV